MRRIAPSLLAPSLLAASLLALGTFCTSPALAQPAGTPAPAKEDPETGTARLNREQADIARQQVAQNAASQKAHDDAVAKQEMDEKMYGAARKERPEMVERYEAAEAQYKEAVAACAARDMVNCPTANQPPQEPAQHPEQD